MTKKQETTESTENSGEPQTPFETFLHHQKKALEETGKALEALLPEGFREHGEEAGKEFVKGFRVLVDAAVEELKKASDKVEAASEDDEGRASSTGATKVKVEVD
jgi:hypothetical protein